MTQLVKWLLITSLLLLGVGIIYVMQLPSSDWLDDEHITQTWSDNTKETTIQLFYYKEDLDKDEAGNIMCNSDAVQPVTRTLSAYNIEDHLQLLLQWPTDKEQAEWFSSEFPLSGFVLENWDLNDDGLLSLWFDDPNLQTVWGSCRVGILASQLIKTIETITGVQDIEVFPEDLFQP